MWPWELGKIISEATHSVQLSYSSPTLGLLGSYVLDGVSKIFFKARKATTRPPMMASNLGSEEAFGNDEICAS